MSILRSAKHGLVIALAAWSLGLSSARADVAPEDDCDLSNSKVGDTCSVYLGEGSCQTATCEKLDYENWDRDASVGPPTKVYECLKCVVEHEDEDDDDDDGSDESADDSTDPPEQPTEDTGNTTEDGDQGTTTPDTSSEGRGGKSSSDEGGSGCSVSLGRVASSFGPWLLAGAFALLVSRKKRAS